jgi:hypothetical protein
VAAALSESQADFLLGEDERQRWQGLRHVAFVPVDGDELELEEPSAVGDLRLSSVAYAQPMLSAPIRVIAHIVAESEEATWLLWQNVLNACRDVMGVNFRGMRFRIPNQATGESSPLYDGAWYVQQDLMWRVTFYKGIVPMPDLKQDVTTMIGTGELVPMETFAENGDALTSEALPQPTPIEFDE